MRAKLISEGVLGSNAYVVIAGPANTYAHYVTTPEEYAMQRYEGASTIFGQWTLDSYIVRAPPSSRAYKGMLTRVRCGDRTSTRASWASSRTGTRASRRRTPPRRT